MNFLVDINHPAQVHLFRNLIKSFNEKGHKIIITIKDIPAGRQLLELYGIAYAALGGKADSLIGKAFNQIKYDWRMWRLFSANDIDLAMGSSITVDHSSRFYKTKALHFSDDDPDIVPLVVNYAHPFADTILCPDCLSFPRHTKKVVKYPGYHELAYLHPKRFTPDPIILEETGLSHEEVFFIMRFNVFKAHHDIGVRGLSLGQKLELVRILAPHGKIFITTERDIEPELRCYQLKVSPEKIHSLMAYATLFVGDSQTMTSEAAVLGTPALKCNSFAGKLSVPNELEERFNLCYSFSPVDFHSMLEKLRVLLAVPGLKQVWQGRRDRMLQQKIDVTGFWIWFVENYPGSKQMITDRPEFWDQFR